MFNWIPVENEERVKKLRVKFIKSNPIKQQRYSFNIGFILINRSGDGG